MNMRKIVLILISFFFLGLYQAQAQDLKDDAIYYFETKDFKKAYDAYDKLLAKSPKNLEYKFRLGYCSLYYPEKKSRSLEIFSELKQIDKSDDIDYYLAKAYHINYKFDEAILSYNQFLSNKGTKVKKDDIPFVEDAKLSVMNCNNGKELIAKKIIADIKNIGSPINTPELEGVPIISADESILIYTYAGKKSTGGLLDDDLLPDKETGTYHEDIFISIKKGDSAYSEPVGIKSLNTKGNDAAVALSPDGNTMFTFSSNNDEGDLFMSTLNGTEWSKPVRLNKNINTEAWEGSCSITSDGRKLYFASERPGGIGGRDLYVSEKINGDWGPAKNLGPEINTVHDEDAPFIHPDGITLFFSSEGHQSIGGYDIMYSVKQDNKWIAPLSMGIPLNTTEDDRYYVINAKGDKGYFSSTRGGAGGKGKQDIYTVEPGILGERPIIALLKGKIFADEKPIEAKISVIRKSTEESIGPYYSNSNTGKYLMALTPGNSYKITIAMAGYETIEEDLDIDKLSKFLEIRKDYYLYSPNFFPKREQKSVKNILDSLLGHITSVETFVNDLKDNNINELVSKEGDTLVINPEYISAITNTIAPKTKTIIINDTPIYNPVTPMPCANSKAIDFSSLKGKSLNIRSNYEKLLSKSSDICVEGLVFKIQIAAYRQPENYKYGHLTDFGTPDILKYPDGITRFTQLQFSTLIEAEAARQKIIESGQKDAWVTAFIGAKRYTLEELILVDFFSKAIN